MQCNGNLKDFKRISHLGPSWKHNRKLEKVFICHRICVLQKNGTSGKVGDDTNCFLVLFEPQPSRLSHNDWLPQLQMCVFPSVHLITTILGRQSPHNHVFHSAPSLLWITASVWVLPRSVITLLCHHIPPRPVPDSDEHWRGGRNESVRLKYGSNYKQKDVRKGWSM